MTSDGWHRRSPLVFLFVAVFVDMIGYGIVVPLLPFYAGLCTLLAQCSSSCSVPSAPRCS